MDWTGIVPFGMDPRPASPQTFAGFSCHSVDENVCYSMEAKMSDMKHFLVEEPRQDNVASDSFLGLGLENMGISSKMDEFSLGLDFSFLPNDYGGLDSWGKQDREAGLKPEILDGFLDEVEEVEHIYSSHHPPSTANHFLPETQVKKEASELDSEPYGLMNFSSESYSPSGSTEWSKETTVPHPESSGKDVKEGFATTISNEMHCVYESEDIDRKPLSALLGSWVGRGGRSRKKNLLNTRCTRSDSLLGGTKSSVSYDFRPRKGPLETCIHHTTVLHYSLRLFCFVSHYVIPYIVAGEYIVI
ncbi:hypothetical protein N665_0276s0016 [Sinapis alba]|nr:hypothetical protein N665_0276s0016 [Sinapis alba]